MSVVTQTQMGSVVISGKSLSDVAGYVATKCYGVVGMVVRSRKDGLAKLLRIENMDKGVKIRTEDNTISIDLFIMVEYGVGISTVCQSIKNNVKYQIENVTRQTVKEVNVFVESVRID